MIVLAIITYVTGAVSWLTLSLIAWSIDRDFPSLHTPEEIQAKARLVLQTPIWPLVLAGMAGRTIGRLVHDAMED